MKVDLSRLDKYEHMAARLPQVTVHSDLLLVLILCAHAVNHPNGTLPEWAVSRLNRFFHEA